jgi:predicted transcriptional regulator of viral defense system
MSLARVLICIQLSMTISNKAHKPVRARNRVLELARTGALFRTRDAIAHGVHAETIARMARAGILERLGPGRYRLAAADVTEHHDLVVASVAVPAAVICLLSALRFHNIGTQLPHQVWIAVRRGTRVPRLSYPPLRAVRISPELFKFGIELHRVEGHEIRVYSLARTVADCFRFRNTIGLDVALEALKEAWRSRRLNLDELHRVAKQLRVNRVMQPYLETIVL